MSEDSSSELDVLEAIGDSLTALLRQGGAGFDREGGGGGVATAGRLE